jgi:hypothetical protein
MYKYGEDDPGLVETRLSRLGTDGQSVVRLWGPNHDDMIMICASGQRKRVGFPKHSLSPMKG